MSTVYPISGATRTADANAAKAPDNQFGQDTFLKLLVAQLKYQDPLHPADATQFLTQTAQFTQLETLQKIEKQQETQAHASEMLAASSMVGRQVTYALNNGVQQAPTPTSVIAVRGTLPKDAAVGSRAVATTNVFTKDGAAIPLTLSFTRTADGWTVQAKNGNSEIGSPLALSFDSSGDHTNSSLSIPTTALDTIPGAAGSWPAAGITLSFGTAGDPTRLQLGSGPATVAVAEQNGNDGTKANGVVTGVHFTTDGPKLVIGGQEIPFASITDVQA
jgi:flagellar basal-body rod modification protein FlgD